MTVPAAAHARSKQGHAPAIERGIAEDTSELSCQSRFWNLSAPEGKIKHSTCRLPAPYERPNFQPYQRRPATIRHYDIFPDADRSSMCAVARQRRHTAALLMFETNHYSCVAEAVGHARMQMLSE